MIPEKFIVSGKDIKRLPLNVVCFEEDLDLVEEYLDQTYWDLINDFEGNILSTDRKYKFIEYLVNFRNAYDFDLFVIRSLSQIQDNCQVAYALKTWVNEDVTAYVTPVYCIESEQIVTYLPETIIDDLTEISDMRDNCYY